MQEMTMTKGNRILKAVGPFTAGVLIGLSVVTPVFGATLDVEVWQPWLLLGSLIVLLIGLILEARSTRRSSADNAGQESQQHNPGDLRWRAMDQSADVALPRLGRSEPEAMPH
jgi:hypothetical protein